MGLKKKEEESISINNFIKSYGLLVCIIICTCLHKLSVIWQQITVGYNRKALYTRSLLLETPIHIIMELGFPLCKLTKPSNPKI